MTSRAPDQRASSRRDDGSFASSRRCVTSGSRLPWYAFGSTDCHSVLDTTIGWPTAVVLTTRALGSLAGASDETWVASSGPTPRPAPDLRLSAIRGLLSARRTPGRG